MTEEGFDVKRLNLDKKKTKARPVKKPHFGKLRDVGGGSSSENRE